MQKKINFLFDLGQVSEFDIGRQSRWKEESKPKIMISNRW